MALLLHLHQSLSTKVQNSVPTVHQLQKMIHPRLIAYPFRILTKCSTSLFFMCFFLPLIYLNVGLDTGRHVLLVWCVTTYVSNFLKDLLMVPRISRHDPTVGLYRSILLRKVGSLSNTNQGRGFGLSSITGLGGGRGSSGGNSLNKRGSGSNARSSVGSSSAGARCSNGDGGSGGDRGGVAGGEDGGTQSNDS